MKFKLSLSICLWLVADVLAQSYWYEQISHQGVAPYNPQGSAYQVYRNVKSFGAVGDGVTDDTAAINQAIANGTRCAPGGVGGCQSSTTSPAIVYFPAGIYLISSPIILYYMTSLVGMVQGMPTLKASPNFVGAGGNSLVDADPYQSTGNPAYITTNTFYRQIRNIQFDTTAVAATTLVRGIHWPTAQSTSLQNCVFKLSQASGTMHQGVWIEEGSGGFMTDLVIYGGDRGLDVGSQQFTGRNLTFYNTNTAIYQEWSWSWTYIGLSINNCGIGLDMTNGGTTAGEVNAMVVIDSSFTNTPVAISTSRTAINAPNSADSLALENIVFANVSTAVRDGNGATSLAGPGAGTSTLATGWVQGNVYSPGGVSRALSPVPAFIRPAALKAATGNNFYTRSKPQYETIPSSGFASVRTAGAKGDGVTDDTVAIQNVITSATAAGIIVFFDAGIYKVTASINIPPGAKIVGEAYPVIMASGAFFSNIANPVPVVRVGLASGQIGVVEWSDMVVSTQGACAGAILIQWNLASPAGTPSGMWDVHTRVGGFQGSNLQVAQCPTTAAQPNQACIGAFQSMRVSNTGTGVYMENNWFWTADHDLDDVNNNNTRLTIYAGRGLSIESVTGNFWLIASAIEHHSLYQYQLSNTRSVFMGLIQTETPYYQPSPNAQAVWTPVSDRIDPSFATFCAGKSDSCNMAWGLRVLNSTDILVYGAGLYSFFSNYDTTCSNHDTTVYNEYCQTQIFGIDEGGPAGTTYAGSAVYVYGLATVGSVSMVDRQGSSVVPQSDNTASYAEAVVRYVVKVPGT